MIGAGVLGIAVGGLFLFMLVWSIEIFPKGAVRVLGYWVLLGSTIETILLVWVLGLILFGDGSWSLSVNDFWQEQMSGIYFIKVWLYSWFWNDLLDFFLAYLPAVLYLSIRGTISTILGIWLLSVARR